MADAPKERWIQWVALTTTVFAVFAAISSLRSSTYSTRAQLYTTEETNRWAFYQAKSLKQHAYELQSDQFKLQAIESADPKVKEYVDERLKKYEAEIARYNTEKEAIKTDAENYASEEAGFKTHGGNFGLAAMFLQIAIMMSSVGALIKKPPMWYVGLALGMVGVVYMLNGLLLFF